MGKSQIYSKGQVRALQVLVLLGLLLGPVTALSADPITSVTDIDGDRIGDLIVYDPTSAKFHTRLSRSATFETAIPGSPGDVPALGDYNGDGRADYTTFNRSSATWSVQFSGGSSVSYGLGAAGDLPVPGNYDNLGCTQLATFNRRTAVWTISDCEGRSTRSENFGDKGAIPVPADFDCDGKTDLATFYPNERRWRVMRSSNSSETTFTFGLWYDLPFAADFSGDGCAQATVYRPDGNFFFVAGSYQEGREASLSQVQQWGLPGDRPTIVNIDGDRAADFAVFRASDSTIYVKPSTNLATFTAAIFTSVDVLNPAVPALGERIAARKVLGDYNRNGRSELACVNVSRNDDRTTWSLFNETGEIGSFISPAFADALVHGDYDGDGRTQPAVIYVNPDRPEPVPLEWHIRRADGSNELTLFGLNGDSPITGDFDCDGKNDRAVVRLVNSEYHWFFDLSSRAATVDVSSHRFGLQGDRIFSADMTGDGCDELIVSREFFGGILWVYSSLLDGVHVPIFPHGLVGDTLLNPDDIDGDGKADLLVARETGGGVDIFPRSSNGQVPYLRFGLRGDTPFTGFRSGVNRPELMVYRRTNQTLYTLRRHIQVTSSQAPCNIIAAPSGSVFPVGRGQVGESPGPIGPIGCVATQGTPDDFFDGPGGSLWKHRSEKTGKPVLLFPGRYWNRVTITILDRNGQEVTRARPRTCCPNGGRSHYDVDVSGSELARVAPITTKVEFNDGTVECRVVENPNSRND